MGKLDILWFLDLNIDSPQFRSQEINQQGICVKHEGGESCKSEIAEKIYAVSLNSPIPRVLLWRICQQQGLQRIIYFAFVCEQVPVSCERAKLSKIKFPAKLYFSLWPSLNFGSQGVDYFV